MRRMFAVGRVDRKTTEIRVIERRETPVPAPFASGPFRLAAVVRSTGEGSRRSR